MQHMSTSLEAKLGQLLLRLDAGADAKEPSHK